MAATVGAALGCRGIMRAFAYPGEAAAAPSRAIPGRLSPIVPQSRLAGQGALRPSAGARRLDRPARAPRAAPKIITYRNAARFAIKSPPKLLLEINCPL